MMSTASNGTTVFMGSESFMVKEREAFDIAD
jgi:hypothetical protein